MAQHPEMREDNFMSLLKVEPRWKDWWLRRRITDSGCGYITKEKLINKGFSFIALRLRRKIKS